MEKWWNTKNEKKWSSTTAENNQNNWRIEKQLKFVKKDQKIENGRNNNLRNQTTERLKTNQNN